MKAKSIYLDYAAATPLDPRVAAAMREAETVFANPSSQHLAGRQAKLKLEAARRRVAQVLGAKSHEIIFTSGSTESDNSAIQGVLYAHPGGGLVTTAIEHAAVLTTAEAARQAGRPVSVVGVEPTGIADPAKIMAAVTDQTVLISIMLVSNEIGTLQPVRQIAQLLAQVRIDRAARGIDLPLYLHTDAAQAGTHLDLQVSRLGIDLMSLNGAKIYGPKTGALYIRQGTMLEPIIFGGAQERGLRPGTPDLAGVMGLAAALELAQAERTSETKRVAELQQKLITAILHIPDAIINGSLKDRLPSNVNFRVKGVPGETAVAYFDAAGIAVATGSACSEADESPSHVLLALGLTPTEAASSLRLTFGRFTTESEIKQVIKSIPDIITRIRHLNQKPATI